MILCLYSEKMKHKIIIYIHTKMLPTPLILLSPRLTSNYTTLSWQHCTALHGQGDLQDGPKHLHVTKG